MKHRLVCVALVAGLAIAGCVSQRQATTNRPPNARPEAAAVTSLRPTCQANPNVCTSSMVFVDIPTGPSPMELPKVLAAPPPATLAVAPGTVDNSIDGTGGDFTALTNLYNNQYIPDVWLVNPGQTVAPTLDVTSMAMPYTLPNLQTPATEYTNLHFHGFNVSPLGNSDNIYRQVTVQDQTAPYSVQVPAQHPVGSFWFHPHPHGISEPQVLGGMSGMISVQGLLEKYYPKTVADAERFFLLKDYLPDGKPCLGKSINGIGTAMVNDGTGNPGLTPKNTTPKLGVVNVIAGHLNFWHFANVGADQFFNIKLIDSTGTPVPMSVIAIDGNATATVQGDQGIATPIPLKHLLLAPGARMDVLVQLPAGTYNLWSDAFDTGTMGDSNCAVQLAWVSSFMPIETAAAAPKNFGTIPKQGNPVPFAIPDALTAAAKAAQAPCQPTRTMTYSQTTDSANYTTFMIDGHAYGDSGSTPVLIPQDPPCTELWQVKNTTPEAHVFHIHQLDYLVLNGDQTIFENETFKSNYMVYQDVVTLPVGTDPVQLLIPFTNPVIQGAFVTHCHILGHEDAGMMRDVCVGDCPNLQPHGTKH